ncbi:MAG: single-stranded-DNA-specific exonuclease RecJ [Thermoleophilia bacterium]|nr:single-stranded-DNA-specific exonuclease RecJ [Thermoleophilia bacterium]
MLVRRGFRDPDAAGAFLEADEAHDPELFDGMAEVSALVMAAVGEGRRVTVYGDFDVDGVAATSILVEVLRELGGECDWFIPDRISDGYGLSDETIQALAARGSELIITVDCGITSVGPVALARELGMEIVVTDHHQPGPELPDCPLLHPEVSGYPFRELCGAAVAAKLATSLRRTAGADPSGDEEDLDLVALATVADVMPLEGENRRLVRQGVAVARRAERVGLAALLAEARVDPVRLTAGDFGFRLGPRINAAGRMYRADAGVELFLADSRKRADEIAAELGRANAERRKVERAVENEAEAARRQLEDPDAAAIVLAGRDWHPGVIGIVASRLVKKHGRPAVVISLGDEGGRGSARGVPGLDLLGAIDSCGDLLEGFGGHRAAAGLQILPERVDDFRMSLNAAVIEQIGPDPADLPEMADALAGGPDIGLDLAEEIELLAPFGRANPEPALLLPGARIVDLKLIGEDRHCRFTVETGTSRASGICFGRTGFGISEFDPVDVLARLEVNYWNGSVTPQLQVREVYPVVPGVATAAGGAPGIEACGPGEWWERFETEFARPVEDPLPGGGGDSGWPAGGRRAFEDPGSPEVLVAELVSSGEGLAILTSDAALRWQDLGGSPGLLRFRAPANERASDQPLSAREAGDGVSPGPDGASSQAELEAGLIWTGSPEAAGSRPGTSDGSGVVIVDYECLAAHPGLIAPFANLLQLDPPAGPAEVSLAATGEGPLIRSTDPDGLTFAEAASSRRYELTDDLRLIYAALRDAAPDGAETGATTGGEELRSILRGEPQTPRSPELAARLLRVLIEVDGARSDGHGDARTAGVVSSGKIDLERSPTFTACARAHKERVRYLRQSNRPAI